MTTHDCKTTLFTPNNTEASTIVEAYSSFAYGVEPRAFGVDDVRHAVAAIERMWKSPGRNHFYVRDEHGRLYELSYDHAKETWFVRSFGETCHSPSEA